MRITRELKVGVFVLSGLLIFIFGYNFLKGFHPLRAYTQYAAVYEDVSGIVPSSQVTINGLKVGQVEKVGMLVPGDASRLVVTFIIMESVKIPVGSTLLISSTDLLGSKALVLQLAKSDRYYLPGDTLMGTNEESMTTSISKMVSPLKEKSEQVLATLDQVLNSMNDVFDSSGTRRLASSINDLSWSIHNVRNITQRFDQLTADEYNNLTSMLENLESITRNLKINNETISLALKNVAKISDSIAAADLTQTINRTQNAMSAFATAMENINAGKGTLGKLASDSSLYQNLDRSSVELAALLKDIQTYPGRYFSVSVFGGGKRAEKADKKRESERKK